MTTASSRCWAEIDGRAIRSNLAYLRSRIEPQTRVTAIVKANGFGHGMIRVARLLAESGVEAFGVAHVHEAEELRAAGLTLPILLLSAALPSEYPRIVDLQCWPLLSTLEEAEALQRVARRRKVVAEAHFKVDTGMGRLGLWQDEAVSHLEEIFQLPNVRILGLATHFAQAEDNLPFTRGQIEEFAEFHSHFAQLPFHVANSAAACQQLVEGACLVRVGLALYGIPPLPRFRQFLTPALTWKSRITLVRRLPAGRTISYGSTYRLPRTQTVATVAVGYGDGYPRSLSNVGFVLFNGKRCPIRGRVTMDQILVDISAAGPAEVGAEVVLIGRQGRGLITIDELSKLSERITYDLATSISARVPRFYLNWS